MPHNQQWKQWQSNQKLLMSKSTDSLWSVYSFPNEHGISFIAPFSKSMEPSELDGWGR